MKWFMRKNVISLGLAVSLVILGATAGIIYRNTVQLIETAAWVAHAHEILEEIGSTLALLTDAEMGRRGYIITGEERQMELYNAAIKVIGKKVSDLRRLTSDNPDQQRRLNALEPLITQKLAVLNDSIQLWKDKPLDAAAQMSLTDKGLRLMEDIRGIATEMAREANRLLKHRDEESRANTQKAILTLFVGNFLSLTLLALVFYRLNREITENKRVQETVSSERDSAFLPDKVTLLPSHQLPLVQTVGGEGFDGNQTKDGIREFNKVLEYHLIETTGANKNITLLGEMGDLLRTCRTPEEVYHVMTQCLQKLFPAESGALCLLTASRNLVEIAAVWGDSLMGGDVFSPDDCWALRRRKLHKVESRRAGLICLHVKRPLSVSFLCVPLLAQDDLLGVLHLINNGPHELHLKEQLAVTVANHIALVLSNLRLREALRGQAAQDPHLLPPVS